MISLTTIPHPSLYDIHPSSILIMAIIKHLRYPSKAYPGIHAHSHPHPHSHASSPHLHVHSSHIRRHVHIGTGHTHPHVHLGVVVMVHPRPSADMHIHSSAHSHSHAHIRSHGHAGASPTDAHIHVRVHIHLHVHSGRRDVHLHIDRRGRRDVHLHIHAHPAHRDSQASQRDLENLHWHDCGSPVDRRLPVVIDRDEGEDEDGLLDYGQIGTAGAGSCQIGIDEEVVDRMQTRASSCRLDICLIGPDLAVQDLHHLLSLSLLSHSQSLEALLEQHLIKYLLIPF
jgi:hypothetical protein